MDIKEKENWRKAIDKCEVAGALLTDLSKAFDCLNHELLIAKLKAYRFDNESLLYIYSYLTDRKHRTKVNNSFSSWSDITSGVQASAYENRRRVIIARLDSYI